MAQVSATSSQTTRATLLTRRARHRTGGAATFIEDPSLGFSEMKRPFLPLPRMIGLYRAKTDGAVPTPDRRVKKRPALTGEDP